MPNHKGFAPILVLLVLGVLATVGFLAFSNHHTEKFSPPNFQGDSSLSSQLSGGKCQGTGTKEFGSPPMNLSDIGSIIPLGLMTEGHVTPIDHIYFSPKEFNGPRDEYPVLAITDGTIVAIQHRSSDMAGVHHGRVTNEYRIVIEYSCSFYSYFDLITSLSPDIVSKAGNTDKQFSSVRIPIKEGAEIGRIGGQTLDFAVWNSDVTLKGFIVPAHYQGELWKIHTDDPFKYFKQPLRNQLLALDQRTVEPRQGKIDYDIDGKLVGNWFKEGTGGYDWARNHQDSAWTNQLSIVYDHLDPTQIRVSMGEYNGKPTQFGVAGNAPDPKDVDKSSGLVKYELVQFDYYNPDGTRWFNTPVKNIQAKNQTQIQGVVLVQMLEDRKIKFETFPGKVSEQVSGFTEKAIIYER